MADIYNRVADAFGGSFAADAAQVMFVQPGIIGSGQGVNAGGGGVGMLVQQLQFTYSQAVTRVYELGSSLSFYVAGRTQGQATMGRILGPRPLALTFYQQYGDVCNAATNTLHVQMAAGCGTPGQFQQGSNLFAFTLRFCVITSIGVSMQAQDMIINEQLQIMFSSLNLLNVSNPASF